MLIPNVISKTTNGERVYDLYSKLLEDRIIFLGEAIDANVANTIIAQLLYLENVDNKKPITMYINTPGGVIHDGLAIYDTMQYISCPVYTITIGLAASMGSIILAGGEKGHRFALPHSEVMIHQPLGGTQGQAKDIMLAAKHIEKAGNRLYKILSKHTGQTIEKVKEDCDRDNFMTAQEAKNYGLIDKILEKIPLNLHKKED